MVMGLVLGLRKRAMQLCVRMGLQRMAPVGRIRVDSGWWNAWGRVEQLLRLL